MNDYLGRRSFRINALDYTLIVLLSFFVIVGISVLIDDISGGSTDVASYIVNLIFIAVFAFPVYKIIMGRITQKKAQTLALIMYQNPDSAMTITEVQQSYISKTGKFAVTESAMEAMLIRLIDKYYLKNMNYDIASHNLISLIEKAPTASFITVICKNCGAQNRIIKGDIQVCQSCGNPLN